MSSHHACLLSSSFHTYTCVGPDPERLSVRIWYMRWWRRNRSTSSRRTRKSGSFCFSNCFICRYHYRASVLVRVDCWSWMAVDLVAWLELTDMDFHSYNTEQTHCCYLSSMKFETIVNFIYIFMLTRGRRTIRLFDFRPALSNSQIKRRQDVPESRAK